MEVDEHAEVVADVVEHAVVAGMVPAALAFICSMKVFWPAIIWSFVRSSLCDANVNVWPDRSVTWPMRSPQNMSMTAS